MNLLRPPTCRSGSLNTAEDSSGASPRLAGFDGGELGSKRRKRVAMGVQIAHFPAIKTPGEFDFTFQPSGDQKLVRELATRR
jgi:DNA replication protein DnaC